MKLKILMILDLVLTLREEKGYQMNFGYYPGADAVTVRWTEGEQEMYYGRSFLDQPETEKELDSIILKLQSL